MKKLYYEIEGLKSVGTNYGTVRIPENIISLNAVRKKKTEYFYNILPHLI